jgi:hypothetical protein
MNDSKRSGWVRLHRSVLESSIFDDPETMYVWMWCLLKATHTPRKFPFNGRDMELEPGQFITSYESALRDMQKMTIRKLRTAWGYLKATGRVTIKATNKFSVITICKWGEYQTDDKQNDNRTTSQRQASDKPATTNKNDKELKEDLPAPKVEFPPELQDETSKAAIEEWLAYKRERREGYKPRGLKAFLTGLVKEGLTGTKLKSAVEYTTFKGWSGIVAKPDPNLTQGPPGKNSMPAESAAFSEALRISVDVASSNPQVKARAEGSDWRIREAIRKTGGSQRYRSSTNFEHGKLSQEFTKAYRELEHTPAPRQEIKAVPDVKGVINTLIHKEGI